MENFHQGSQTTTSLWSLPTPITRARFVPTAPPTRLMSAGRQKRRISRPVPSRQHVRTPLLIQGAPLPNGRGDCNIRDQCQRLVAGGHREVEPAIGCLGSRQDVEGGGALASDEIGGALRKLQSSSRIPKGRG